MSVEIRIQLTEAGLQISFPQDEILTLGLLEKGKDAIKAKFKEAEEGRLIQPVSMGMPRIQ